MADAEDAMVEEERTALAGARKVSDPAPKSELDRVAAVDGVLEVTDRIDSWPSARRTR